MWRKNLILSLACTVLLPILECNAVNKDVRDGVELQPERIRTEAGGMASEAVLAVPADVKWAHRLATGLAALGAIAGVVQLGYIWKYWRELGAGIDGKGQWYHKQGQVFLGLDDEGAQCQAVGVGQEGSRDLREALRHHYLGYEGAVNVGSAAANAIIGKIVGCGGQQNGVKAYLPKYDIIDSASGKSYNSNVAFSRPIMVYFSKGNDRKFIMLKIKETTQYFPNKDILKNNALGHAISTPMFALATGWLYRYPPVLKPEAASRKTRVAALATGVIGITALWRGMQGVFNARYSKGCAVQIAAFGGMLLCKAYATLRVMYLNDKTAEALAHKANTGAVAGDQAKQLKLA